MWVLNGLNSVYNGLYVYPGMWSGLLIDSLVYVHMHFITIRTPIITGQYIPGTHQTWLQPVKWCLRNECVDTHTMRMQVRIATSTVIVWSHNVYELWINMIR